MCTPCPQNSWSAAGARKCTANARYFFLDRVPTIQLSMQSSVTDNAGSAAATMTKSESPYMAVYVMVQQVIIARMQQALLEQEII